MPFTEYHLDPSQFSFLEVFRKNWEAIRDEYHAFVSDDREDKSVLYRVMSPRTSVVKTKADKQYTAIGLMFQGKMLEEFIEEYGLTWPDLDMDEIKPTIRKVRERYFPVTMRCVKEAIELSKNRVRTVYFSIYAPGMDVKLHVNRDLHEYRGYLGLDVPEGDVAIKICGETLKWKDGEFLVLDHAFPHCPHNHTPEPRVALLVDFLKPDKPYQEMLALEKEIVGKRMKANPYSYGIFGTDDVVPPETFSKYGMEDQLQWESKDLV